MSLDLALQHAINGLAGTNRPLDLLMIVFAQYSPFAYALILLATYFAGGRERRVRRLVAVRAGLASVVGVAVSGLIGHVWDRPRPFVVHPATDHLLIHHAADASFPSDHATLAFAVAAGLAPLGPAWGWLLGIAGAVVAFARVFVGVHWPSDVVGGAILGGLAARAVIAVAPRLDPLLGQWMDRLGPLGRDEPGRQAE